MPNAVKTVDFTKLFCYNLMTQYQKEVARMKTPLADRVRPTDIEKVVGQHHLLDNGKILRRIIESGEIPNLIFYGPSGVGKTTVANIIAKKSGKTLYRLHATTA